MPSRSSASDLARLFDRSVDPIYVVDAQRRLVYLNQACSDWLGRPCEELLGAECRYHSEPGDQGRAPVTALICPPPATFHGQRGSADIAIPSLAGESAVRAVEFLPLTGNDGQVVGILATVSLAVQADRQEHEPPAVLDTAGWHMRLEQFRRSQRFRYHLDRLLGDSPALQRVRAQVAAAADNTASVLIVGPAGSGREHVARAIHEARGNSAAGPLVPVACSLLGAELLQTAIRGLARPKPTGLAQQATLLLNDVDQMPLDAQSELLGFLRLMELPFRVIATAREALLERGGDQRFHPELAWRLSTLVIELPPLTDRLEDLPLLAQMLLEQLNAGGEKQLAGFTPEALEQLAAYAWPQQIDELAEVVRQAHAHAAGPWIAVQDLPPRLFLAAAADRHPRRHEETIVLERFLAEIERELIERAFKQAKGNKTRAAKLLGMTRPRLYRRLVQLGLEPGEP